ncbi:MAG: hypothetical protein Q4F79_03105 [Eubacteriales bacterium]|nr:hypothetical protein [Eubacteriales bacterium]
MQVLSMTGFRKICEEIAPASFIYDTENQPGGTNKDAKMVMRYSDVAFMLNPNRICFKNDAGTLCLNRVKSIRCHDNTEMVGQVFSIVCGNAKNTNSDVSYTIIADTEKYQSKL